LELPAKKQALVCKGGTGEELGEKTGKKPVVAMTAKVSTAGGKERESQLIRRLDIKSMGRRRRGCGSAYGGGLIIY